MSTESPATVPGRITHLTPAERSARGRAARQEVPRSSQATRTSGPDRDDPIALLESQSRTRIPELVPLRYSRMMASPFAFYRGGALIMAADLATVPQSGLWAQICGDAHLSNFGIFASPERQTMFDLTDFDETLPGPWEWDLKRLATSFEIAGRERGFDRETRRDIVRTGVTEYRSRMSQAAASRTLDVWYAHVEAESLLRELKSTTTKKQRALARKSVDKAKTRDNLQAFNKLTGEVDGQRRILADPPLIVPIEDVAAASGHARSFDAELRELIRTYRSTLQSDRQVLLEEFDYVHAARKVVGVGSVGTRAWILLLLGRDDRDPLLLQAKEAEESVLARYVGKSVYANHGQRVVAGQRLMQAASDIFLGWQRVTGLDGQTRDYYIRQLRDRKGSADVETMGDGTMRLYARLCGATLARAHARSGDRIAIAAYLGKSETFDDAVADFARAYADQNERDHEALVRAVRSGRVDAHTGQ